MNYSQLLNAAIDLYGDDKFKEAYDLITKESQKILCNDAQIYNFRYSMACVMGEVDLGLELLREAVIDKGMWWSYDYLMSDEDLEVLKDKPLFVELAEICKKRETIALENAVSNKLLIKGEADDAPLLIVLHGDQENIEIVKDHWLEDIFRSHNKLFVQSSVEEFSTGYVWEDPIQGVLELKSHMDELSKAEMDRSHVTLAAFSAGGSVALQGLVDDVFQVKNLFLLAPWLPNFETLQDRLHVLKTNGTKIVIACGDADDDCYDESKKLSEALAKVDIEHEFYVLEGVQHEYPTDFKNIIESAVEYFNK